MISNTPFFLCCDWGTTGFRLRLIDRSSVRILQEVVTTEGSAVIYDKWINSDKTSADARVQFYLDVIRKHITAMERQTGMDLMGVPILICGMSSSSIGMKELPYARTPFRLDGSGLITDLFTDVDGREIVLVSGLRTETDVMRGEEVQLIGLEKMVRDYEKTNSGVIVLLPGTHSKHVYIKNHEIVDFVTSLTGEMFELLSSHGLLRQSVESSSLPPNTDAWDHFRQGVQFAGKRPFLQSLFSVRTNDLFNKISPPDNYYYLSGLLIGYELKELKSADQAQIILCSPDHLAPYYDQAMKELGLSDHVYSESPARFSQYFVEAQVRILENMRSDQNPI